ncbi:hypothetical protein [Oligella urethralis]|uniref:DNA binding HTH domain-containing protein n=1 Tax=Oligella urethralis DNF00040 TaxID=1401065 RepID=A0A095ZD71_9BURK|nr:hypothetical protein [Oligella urethralis]KGF32608.1 hypothetical protein HMPREF2130_00190 [Oligella urethralis DNF00040]
MKQTLDCAILHFDQVAGRGVSGQAAVADGYDRFKQVVIKHKRLRIHDVALSELVPATDELQFREEDRQFLLMQLMRYDVVILLLNTESLSLARRFLFFMHSAEEFHPNLCPVFALVSGVQPVAMIDLLRLGLSDFMRYPINQEELRVRLLAAANKPSLRRSRDDTVTRTATHDGIVSLSAPSHPSYQEPKRAFFEALLRSAEQHTGHYAFAFSDQHVSYYNEGFKEAKQNVVDRFEHGYLSYMLRSTKGNIAQAATLAKKNRRSFWELMRKHKIDAEQFRPDV